MAGSSTISISETKAEALTLQSSAYGVTVPVVGGVNRVAGNLIWYSDFRAIPHTETQSSGKAGGAQTKSTTYTYSVSVAMGICHGQVAVGTIWRDKEVFRGGWTEDNVGTASEDWTVPTSGPMAYTMIHGETAIAEPRVRRGKTDLTIGTHYTLSGSVITVVDAEQRGKALKIEYQYGIGDPDLTPLQQIGATLMQGSTSQGSPPWMTSLHPDQARTYPGLAYIHAQDYDLGSSTGVDNHSFEVIGWGAYNAETPGPDCNPAAFTAMVLAHTRFGARMPSAQIDTADWETYCAAAGLLMSPVLKEQQRAADFVDDMARLTNSAPVWSYDRLKIVPYGDVELSRFGVTYTPNVTPVYDLNDDCWIVEGDEDPIEWEQRQPSDRYNIVRVEYANREQDYNRCIAEARDDADIERYGERLMDTVVCPWICDAEVARLVAEGIKQRSLLITGSGRVRLPWAYCLLEPMDLLTITDSRLGFDALPVRITGVTETEDGVIELELEDWPLGVADVARYQAQPAAGYLHDYGVAPGSVDPPAIFEAPVQRTTTGLEVWAAVRGASPSWGGCRMWVSLDGDSYREAAVIYGPARYGSLTGPVAGDSMPVQTSGQLVSASADDASALETLVYVGGASPEYMAYTTATLTGTGLYTLGGLVRGAYSFPQAAHAAGDMFVRVDDRIAKSGPLDPALIGSAIRLKFTSFNLYQSAEQSIADVPAYEYTIAGPALPPAPLGLWCELKPGVVEVRWDAGDVLMYSHTEVHREAAWSDATGPVFRGNASGFLVPWPDDGTYVYLAKNADTIGRYSEQAARLAFTVSGTTLTDVTVTWLRDSLQPATWLYDIIDPESGEVVGTAPAQWIGGPFDLSLEWAVNFDARNDRLGTIPPPVTIATDGSAVDRTLNPDGSVDVSLEWSWAGDEATIDGFEVMLHIAHGGAAYVVGADPASERVQAVPASKRAMIAYGVNADSYITWAVRPYRIVDADIDPAQIIHGAWRQPSAADENPYRPSSQVAFAGDITGTVSGIPASRASVWDDAAINFDSRNDRLATTPAPVTIATDGSAIDHTPNPNATVDVSLEWSWTGDEATIDGFEVMLHAGDTSAPYTAGSAPESEMVLRVPARMRAQIWSGLLPTYWLTMAVRPYRIVDPDIDSSGVIHGAWRQPSGDENPYRPSSQVAFAGDVTGTVSGIPAADVNVWSAITGVNVATGQIEPWAITSAASKMSETPATSQQATNLLRLCDPLIITPTIACEVDVRIVVSSFAQTPEDDDSFVYVTCVPASLAYIETWPDPPYDPRFLAPTYCDWSGGYAGAGTRASWAPDYVDSGTLAVNAIGTDTFVETFPLSAGTTYLIGLSYTTGVAWLTVHYAKVSVLVRKR